MSVTKLKAIRKNGFSFLNLNPFLKIVSFIIYGLHNTLVIDVFNQF